MPSSHDADRGATAVADGEPRSHAATPAQARGDRRDARASRRARAFAGVRAFAASHWRTGAVVVVLAIVSWPFAGLAPNLDDDSNWMVGLDLVARSGVRYGSQFDWTYGPLGFLGLRPTLLFGDSALMRFVAQWLLQLALAGTLYCAARRSFAPIVAFVVAGVAVVLVPDRQVALAFALCALALLRDDDTDRDGLARAFPVAIGILAGLLLLDKLNGGVEATVLAVIALIARPARRRVDAATFAAALVGTVAITWLATGQRLADLVPYVRYGVETVAGYAGAMGVADPAGAWHYWAAALLAALGTTLAWDAVRDAEPRRRWGLLLMWAGFAFMAFKEGFVRHDAGHAATFMGAMLVAFVVFPVTPARRPLSLAGIGIAAVLFSAMLAPFPLGHALDPYANAKALVDQAKVLAVRDHRGAAKSRHREMLRAAWAIPDPILQAVGDRSVTFWPHSLVAAAYAYELDWRPLPVVESYGTYTSALDRLDADMLASSRAPERIVRSTAPIYDGRNPTFEAPEATLRILCDYREVARAVPYQALAHGDDRCGQPQPLATVEAAWGAPVGVPAPRRADDAVIVRIDGAGPAGLERLKALWLRPDVRTILLDGKPNRLIAGTAGDGLLLRVPADADYAAPLAMAPNPTTISVRREGSQPGGLLRYRFEELSVEPFAAGGAQR